MAGDIHLSLCHNTQVEMSSEGPLQGRALN